MAKSNKPIVWSLFAAGGTVAAFLAPVLALLFLLMVIALFLWHAAHRLRVTLHDFGLRQDAAVAVVVYVIAAAGTLMSVLYLLRI